MRSGMRAMFKWGAVGIFGMAAFYVAVVWGASGSATHLVDQIKSDWYLIAPVILGFGTQVGLLGELRRRHRLDIAAATAGGSGATASTAGMIACCAHHIADLLPFLGLSGAATFLYDYRAGFVGLGLTMNAIGITIATRRLRHLPRPTQPPRTRAIPALGAS